MSSNPSDGETIIDRLLQDDEILEAMLSMPQKANEDMVENRREELFSFFWEKLDLEQEFVLNCVRDQEDEFISDYSGVSEDVPEWLLRAEAQDLFLEYVSEEFSENLD